MRSHGTSSLSRSSSRLAPEKLIVRQMSNVSSPSILHCQHSTLAHQVQGDGLQQKEQTDNPEYAKNHLTEHCRRNHTMYFPTQVKSESKARQRPEKELQHQRSPQARSTVSDNGRGEGEQE